MSEYRSIFSDKTFGKLKASSAQSLRDMLGGRSFMDASMEVFSLLPQIISVEKQYKEYLEELAKEVLKKAYPIVEQADIIIEAELVGAGDLTMPQNNPPDEEEVEEFLSKPGIDKRRIINSITQGASIRGAKAFYIFKDIIDVLDDTLVEKYESILQNSFGIYDDDNAIAFMLAMLAQNQGSQSGESDVEWDEDENTLKIKAKGTIFPILVHELVKGLYEILSLQGFSNDPEKNKDIVSKVDKASNEPEDLRYGKFVYDALAQHVIDSPYDPTELRELFFVEIYKLPDNEFFEFVENSINNELTTSQKIWVNNTLKTLNDEN